MTGEPDLTELRVKMARDVVKALYLVGEDLAGKAARLAPVEEGTLRASAAVVLIVNGSRFEGAGALVAAQATASALAAERQAYTVNVEVSFNTIYAARQHEETEWEHPLGGQAKYLEQPLRENVDRYMRIVATAAGDATSAGPTTPSPPQDDIPF